MLIERFSTVFAKRNEKIFSLSKQINCVLKINKKSLSSLSAPIIQNSKLLNELNGKYVEIKKDFKLSLNLSSFIRQNATSTTNNTDNTTKSVDTPELNIEHQKNGLKQF